MISLRHGQVASHHFAVSFSTESLGWITIVWKDERLARVVFGHALAADSRQSAMNSCPDLDPQSVLLGGSPALLAEYEDSQWNLLPENCRRLILLLEGYSNGEPVDFGDIPLADDNFTPFQRRVMRHCRRIGFGETASYQQLAEKAGSPRAARAVGSVMANNRFPLVVPCHRIVGSQGHLGGFSAPGGLDTKRRLLKLEQSQISLGN